MGTWLKRRGTLALGLVAALVAALAVAGAASADHTASYNGAADRHEFVDGNPPLCPAVEGGKSFRIDASDLTEGGEYPSDDPIIRITSVDVEGGTLSWQLLATQLHRYDVAAIVMKGGSGAMVYYYDASASGLDDSDSGLTTPINTNGEADPRPFGISHIDVCLDPKADTGVDDLVVTKTASTNWEKVYTWEVEKSVDRPQLQLQSGGSGTVNWTVDVTQSGSFARNAVVTGTISVENPNDEAVTDVSVSDALAGAVVDCDAGAAGAQSTGLTVPGNGSLSCTYSAARETTDGGTNSASATGSLERCRRVGYRHGGLHVRCAADRDQQDGLGRRRRERRGAGSRAPPRSHTTRSSAARARAGRTSSTCSETIRRRHRSRRTTCWTRTPRA